MIEAGRGGSLLATTSAAAFFAYPGFPMFGATKAATNGLVRTASLELSKLGIQVNLCPTHGMSINFAVPGEADVVGRSYEEMQDWDPDARPMPLRLNHAPNLRDNAYLALYFASDESAYTSGQTILSADGGNAARASIVFPTDTDESADLTAGTIPEELRAQIQR